jgi:leucine-zipper-like transcriptional regulator 1
VISTPCIKNHTATLY